MSAPGAAGNPGSPEGVPPIVAVAPTTPPGRPPEPRAWASRAAWIALLCSLIVGLIADLASKHLAFRFIADSGPVVVDRAAALALPPASINSLIPRHDAVVVIPRVLHLQLVLNPGAVFGVGPGKQMYFAAFAAVAVGFGMWMFGAWTSARDRWSHIAIGLILAGGLGNLYDRLVYGCVRDFLHPLAGVRLPFGLSWPSGSREAWPYVSNVADALLLIGVGVLLVRMWRKPAPDYAPPRPSA